MTILISFCLKKYINNAFHIKQNKSLIKVPLIYKYVDNDVENCFDSVKICLFKHCFQNWKKNFWDLGILCLTILKRKKYMSAKGNRCSFAFDYNQVFELQVHYLLELNTTWYRFGCIIIHKSYKCCCSSSSENPCIRLNI